MIGDGQSVGADNALNTRLIPDPVGISGDGLKDIVVPWWRRVRPRIDSYRVERGLRNEKEI